MQKVKIQEHTFNPQSTYLIEMIAIYVSVHPEQSPHDRSHGVSEVPRERNTDFVREGCLVIEDILSPVHQCIDVFRGRKFGWPFELDTVFPEVFVPDGG